MHVQTIAEQLFFVTCRIEAQAPAGLWTGTGFVYAVETNQGVAHFLVTNRHVFTDPVAGSAHTVTLRFVHAIPDSSGSVTLGKATQTTITGFGPDAWEGHPDADIDVAVMPLTAVLNDMTQRGVPAFFRAVSPEMSLGVGTAFETDAVENLVFIGYPNGLFDTESYLPILRRGLTATPLEVDYQGKPAFLMDASVFPGSSGSPVFILDRGTYVDRQGNTTIGSRLAFVGVVAGVHTRIVNGTVVQVSTGLLAQFQDLLDLGIVYKATAIDDVVQRLLDRAGLTRKPGGDVLTPVEGPSPADEAVAPIPSR